MKPSDNGPGITHPLPERAVLVLLAALLSACIAPPDRTPVEVATADPDAGAETAAETVADTAIADAATPTDVTVAPPDLGNVQTLDTGAKPDTAATDATTAADTTAADTKPDTAPPSTLPAGTYPLTLQNGASPPAADHPSAVAVVPAGLDPKPPLALVVYLHGHYNCALNVIGDADTACKQGGAKRPASKLRSQLEASQRNALLLVPELAFDMASSDPGKLGQAGGFKALVQEALAQLQPALGTKTVADLGTIVVASHSGGYLAAAGIASQGGLPVHELWLLDSLYGQYPQFSAWLQQNKASFASPWQRRFADVYTQGGGTLQLSWQLADATKAWAPKNSLVDDRTTATWPPATYDHGLLFKLSGLSHHGVTTYYVQQLLATSSLPPK